jgi:GntR family transcriptional regulator, rspAB operon transcriptional repressor
VCLSRSCGRRPILGLISNGRFLGFRLADDSHTTGYRRFRQAMQEGRLQPGMIITQNELCTILDISLTPLRETLVLLEEFGLVEVKPRAGIRIVYPEVTFIRENYQFRSLIELRAIKQFAPNAPADWLAHMRRSHEALEAQLRREESVPNLFERWVALDAEFHTAFVKSLQNHAISAVYDRIMDNINLARQVHDRTALRTRVIDSAREHLAILKALEDGNADAAAAGLELHFQASTYRTLVAA